MRHPYLIIPAAFTLSFSALAADLTGKWVTDTLQTRSGKVQNEYTFKADGTFISRSDDRGLCEKQAKCEHFWMISEGTYALKGDTLTLNIQKERGALKSSDNPDVVELPKPGKPYSLSYTVSRQGSDVKLVDTTSRETLPLRSVGARASQATRQPAQAERQVASVPRVRPANQSRRLPDGDMRHCLELKDNAAIIACSEKR